MCNMYIYINNGQNLFFKRTLIGGKLIDHVSVLFLQENREELPRMQHRFPRLTPTPMILSVGASRGGRRRRRRIISPQKNFSPQQNKGEKQKIKLIRDLFYTFNDTLHLLRNFAMRFSKRLRRTSLSYWIHVVCVACGCVFTCVCPSSGCEQSTHFCHCCPEPGSG